MEMVKKSRGGKTLGTLGTINGVVFWKHFYSFVLYFRQGKMMRCAVVKWTQTRTSHLFQMFM